MHPVVRKARQSSLLELSGGILQRVLIPGTELEVTRFSFGTASLHHVGPKARQVDHLLSAAASGFSHFDAAPLYGFGGAEEALGEAFGNNPDITIATKVGLYPRGGTSQSRLGMLTRKALGAVFPSITRPIADGCVEVARKSLGVSLRKLRRDHVDILFLHDPDIQLFDTDEWQSWIEQEGNRIRNIGVAGPAKAVEPFVKAKHPLAKVIQTRDCLTTLEADFLARLGREMQLTYGYLSNDSCRHEPAEILLGALQRNRSGSILVSTRDRARLSIYAALAGSGS